jgi:hypothetical protein
VCLPVGGEAALAPVVGGEVIPIPAADRHDEAMHPPGGG